jgi:hypothetical protein
VRDAQWLLERHPDEATAVFNGERTLASAITRTRPVEEPERNEASDLVLDSHPPMAQVAPVNASSESALLAAVREMETTDPGVWALGLPNDARRTILTVLDNFARRAYDVADEQGLL